MRSVAGVRVDAAHCTLWDPPSGPQALPRPVQGGPSFALLAARAERRVRRGGRTPWPCGVACASAACPPACPATQLRNASSAYFLFCGGRGGEKDAYKRGPCVLPAPAECGRGRSGGTARQTTLALRQRAPGSVRRYATRGEGPARLQARQGEDTGQQLSPPAPDPCARATGCQTGKRTPSSPPSSLSTCGKQRVRFCGWWEGVWAAPAP